MTQDIAVILSGGTATIHFETVYTRQYIECEPETLPGLLVTFGQNERYVQAIIPDGEYAVLWHGLHKGIGAFVIECRDDTTIMFSRAHALLAVTDLVDGIAYPMTDDDFNALWRAMGAVLGWEKFSGGVQMKCQDGDA